MNNLHLVAILPEGKIKLSKLTSIMMQGMSSGALDPMKVNNDFEKYYVVESLDGDDLIDLSEDKEALAYVIRALIMLLGISSENITVAKISDDAAESMIRPLHLGAMKEALEIFNKSECVDGNNDIEVKILHLIQDLENKIEKHEGAPPQIRDFNYQNNAFSYVITKLKDMIM